MNPSDRVLVNCGNGLLVAHTWSEWLALIRGVDMVAARALGAPSATNSTTSQEISDED